MLPEKLGKETYIWKVIINIIVHFHDYIIGISAHDIYNVTGKISNMILGVFLQN